VMILYPPDLPSFASETDLARTAGVLDQVASRRVLSNVCDDGGALIVGDAFVFGGRQEGVGFDHPASMVDIYGNSVYMSTRNTAARYFVVRC
jgi:hypothetical protein